MTLWVKLYEDINSDPRFLSVSLPAQAIYMRLLPMVKRGHGSFTAVPSKTLVETVLTAFHQPYEVMEPLLRELADVELIHLEADRINVPRFAQRQAVPEYARADPAEDTPAPAPPPSPARMTNAERQRRYRESRRQAVVGTHPRNADRNVTRNGERNESNVTGNGFPPDPLSRKEKKSSEKIEEKDTDGNGEAVTKDARESNESRNGCNVTEPVTGNADRSVTRDGDGGEEAPQTPLRGADATSASDSAPKAKTPRKARSRPTSAPEPMPWTIAEMLAELARTAPARAVVSPFDQALAKPLTLVIRGLATGGCTFADITLVGEWFAAGGLGFLADGIGLSWLAKGGNLADAIGKARKWHEAGRPSLGTQGSAPRLVAVPREPPRNDDIRSKLHFPKTRFSEDPKEREREMAELKAKLGITPKVAAAQ